MLHLIRFSNVCRRPTKRTLGLHGLNQKGGGKIPIGPIPYLDH